MCSSDLKVAGAGGAADVRCRLCAVSVGAEAGKERHHSGFEHRLQRQQQGTEDRRRMGGGREERGKSGGRRAAVDADGAI